jgi:hypothetical protein
VAALVLFQLLEVVVEAVQVVIVKVKFQAILTQQVLLQLQVV